MINVQYTLKNTLKEVRIAIGKEDEVSILFLKAEPFFGNPNSLQIEKNKLLTPSLF